MTEKGGKTLRSNADKNTETSENQAITQELRKLSERIAGMNDNLEKMLDEKI